MERTDYILTLTQINQLNKFYNNLVETNGTISYIEHFDQNNATIVISEDSYAIASMQDNYLLVIDYNSGKREELKIDLDNIMSAPINKKNNFDIEPSSSETEKFGNHARNFLDQLYLAQDMA